MPAQAADLTQKVPSVKVTTRLVIVDVVAHDKKGHAITDLEAADLRILEDGKEQPIRSFVFQRGVQSAEKAAQEPACSSRQHGQQRAQVSPKCSPECGSAGFAKQ